MNEIPSKSNHDKIQFPDERFAVNEIPSKSNHDKIRFPDERFAVNEIPSKSNHDKIRFSDERFAVIYRRTERRADGEDFLPMRWHEQVEIKIVLADGAVTDCEGKTVGMRTGDIILINPRECHVTRFLTGTPVYDMLIFDPELLRGLPDSEAERSELLPFLSGKLRFRNKFSDPEAVRPLLEDVICELRERRPGYEWMIRGQLSRLFAILLRNERQPSASEKNGNVKNVSGDRLLPALDHIHRNAADREAPMRLSDLAELCHMSETYFCALFRSLTGYTAMRYVNRVRILRAQELLLTTDEPVAQVADESGFPDACYFNRCFKKYVKMTPTDYREHAAVPGETGKDSI